MWFSKCCYSTLTLYVAVTQFKIGKLRHCYVNSSVYNYNIKYNIEKVSVWIIQHEIKYPLTFYAHHINALQLFCTRWFIYPITTGNTPLCGWELNILQCMQYRGDMSLRFASNSETFLDMLKQLFCTRCINAPDSVVLKKQTRIKIQKHKNWIKSSYD